MKPPQERLLLPTPDASVHLLMDRIDAVDREVGLAIAKGLKAQRVRLPDRDAAVLLRWADRTYGF